MNQNFQTDQIFRNAKIIMAKVSNWPNIQNIQLIRLGKYSKCTNIQIGQTFRRQNIQNCQIFTLAMTVFRMAKYSELPKFHNGQMFRMTWKIHKGQIFIMTNYSDWPIIQNGEIFRMVKLFKMTNYLENAKYSELPLSKVQFMRFSKQTHNLKTTSFQSQCNVMTLHRRW